VYIIPSTGDTMHTLDRHIILNKLVFQPGIALFHDLLIII